MSGNTAVVIIDPYNDFLHSEGKLNGLLADSMKETDTIRHLHEMVVAARAQKSPFRWNHATRMQESQKQNVVFEEGSWGTEMYESLAPDLGNGDVIVFKHWSSSSFQNRDLNYQLRQCDITNLVLGGSTSKSCLESTARYPYELGYHVTMLKDTTASFSKEQKDAATQLIWPLFAHEVKEVGEWILILDK